MVEESWSSFRHKEIAEEEQLMKTAHLLNQAAYDIGRKVEIRLIRDVIISERKSWKDSVSVQIFADELLRQFDGGY
jgi:hypothetical protein